MPSSDTLQKFIARVEQNAHVEAIQEFYTEDASMQENQTPARVGRDVLVAHESRAMSKAKSVQSRCVHPILINGDVVVIRWKFRFEWLDNTISEIEELTYQQWRGERIAQEQFFYDPATFKPKDIQ